MFNVYVINVCLLVQLQLYPNWNIISEMKASTSVIEEDVICKFISPHAALGHYYIVYYLIKYSHLIKYNSHIFIIC